MAVHLTVTVTTVSSHVNYCFFLSYKSIFCIFKTKRTNTCFALVGDFVSVKQKRSGIKNSCGRKSYLPFPNPSLSSASHAINTLFGFWIPLWNLRNILLISKFHLNHIVSPLLFGFRAEIKFEGLWQFFFSYSLSPFLNIIFLLQRSISLTIKPSVCISSFSNPSTEELYVTLSHNKKGSIPNCTQDFVMLLHQLTFSFSKTLLLPCLVLYPVLNITIYAKDHIFLLLGSLSQIIFEDDFWNFSSYLIK